MDLNELLSYQPSKGPKHKLDDEDETNGELKKKTRRLIDMRDPASYPDEERPEITDEERNKILKMVEEEPEAEPFDDNMMKKLILAFEKKVLKNQELRIKFPDLPEKFMESEINLNENIQELHVIATAPDMYHLLVELNAAQSFLGLLTHENADIAIAVVDLIQELTDVDTLNESEDGAAILIDTFLDGQIIALLVQNMERLDETIKEESEGIHNSLAIIENMIEFQPEICVNSSISSLIQWILKRLKAKIPFDANKLYCSEMLSILLQNHEDNRKVIGELDGIDVLLQQLAYFKRHNPNSAEETEMMENLFNCLCSSLMLSSNRDKFLKGEGLQLMNLMLKEKKLSRNGALKVLDYAMHGLDGSDNCAKFVDILGLRTIFPLFMKTPSKYKRQATGREEHEEHVLSVIASMLRNCKGPQKQRLLNKFTENDHEKVDRLMEMHFKYLEKVQAEDSKIDIQKKEKARLGEEIDANAEDEYYIQRLDAGLFSLQLIDCVIMEVCTAGTVSIKQRVLQMLNLRGGSISTIRDIMREYAGNIGDAIDADAKEIEKQRLMQLVNKF